MNPPSFRLLLLLSLAVALSQGCNNTAPSAAPAPQTVSGMTRDRTSYTFLKWDDGLAIMLVDECEVHHMSGSNTAGEPCRLKGDAHSLDKDTNEWKDGYRWQLETTDGRTGILTINDTEYDLAKGAVFRIDTSADKPTVQQIDVDLSNIHPNRQSCNRFVTAHPKLKKPNEESNTE